MRKRTSNRRWTIVGLITLGLLGIVPISGALAPGAAQAAAGQPGDGTAAATAGASCWGIKGQYPASATGSYWLLTSSMDRPAEFHCDMTTDGGGWVLVGRGRNGWTFAPGGQGSPAAITATPDGTGAFSPAALPTETINGLLDDATVPSLTDGVRVERALSTDGQTRQDYRLFPQRQAWTWSLPTGQLLDRVQITGTTYQGSNTKDTARSAYGQSTNGLAGIQDTRRLSTTPTAAQGYRNGFALGDNVGGGSTSGSNFLWSQSSSGPLPFSRVWIRPRIANDAAGFTPIPAAGFPAKAKPANLEDRPEIAPWGVEGYNHDDEARVEPWNSNVMVVKVYGDRVYVGGRFRTVKQGPGGPEFAQGSLAAFDLDGNWISTFRPQIPGRVWDMTMTDDGKLIIGGDFASVDGVPGTSGMVALDPATGQVNTAWRGNATRTTGNVIVRSLDSRGGWIYAAGRFNRIQGGTSAETPITNAISLRTSNGSPGLWRPQVYASALDLKVSAAGNRIYLAGYFNSVNGDTNHGYYGITKIADGAPVPGMGPYRPSHTSALYQQAVGEAGDNILVGGSQHDLQMYDHDRQGLIDSHITRAGGDFQAIETIGGYVYAACHCLNETYSGTNSFANPSGFRSVDPIRLVGRWDAQTFDYDTSWYPNGLKGGSRDDGIWSVAPDARGCLWVGGDLERGSYSGNAARDYLGGFGRFCPTDSTPPSAPSDLRATAQTGTVGLTWNAATDDRGSVAYDVYRDDRVITTVYGTTYTDTIAEGEQGPFTYTVRAADGRGNLSASPAPVSVDGSAPQLATPIPYGSVWSYSDTGTDLGTAWRDGALQSWASGPAPLGWNGTYATEVGPTHPTTTYFRRSFDVADPSQFAQLDIGALFTQGAVVYVNGVEVGRTNMATGAIGYSTVANQYVGGSTDRAVKTYAVPPNLLRAGSNTLAVEVHGWRANPGKVFFDLEATLRGRTADVTAPSAPSLTATAAVGEIDLSWTPSTDDEALGGYLVTRNDQNLAVVAATATTYVDPGVDTSTPTTYRVTAFDTAGNTTPSNAVEVGTVGDPTTIAFGSDWSWWYQADAPAPGWQGTSYDLTGWQSGAGEFGFGDGVAATVISTDPAPRPLTAYFRRTVDIADPGRYPTYAVDLIANAGAVVYVNGIEVARDNMRTGPVDHGTYAPTAPSSGARHTPMRYEIPASAFTAGTNTIAVEIHNNWRSQPTMGFDLALTGLA